MVAGFLARFLPSSRRRKPSRGGVAIHPDLVSVTEKHQVEPSQARGFGDVIGLIQPA